MVAEKNQRLKIINIITWLIMAGITLTAYFMPLNERNVLQMEQLYPGPLIGPSLIWYLYFLTLLALGLFVWFQARGHVQGELVRMKTRHILGWTVGASFLLYTLSIVLWHFEFMGWATFTLILTTLVLIIINGNIREEPDVLFEKFWVRNPFSFFLGWVLYLLMTTIAMRWQATFSNELPALGLFLVFIALVIVFSLRNSNVGVPVLWTIAILLNLLQNQAPRTLRSFHWVALALLVIFSFLIIRRGPQTRHLRKPVARAMDKFNYGRPSQLEALEEELNSQLQTKPGARITLK